MERWGFRRVFLGLSLASVAVLPVPGVSAPASGLRRIQVLDSQGRGLPGAFVACLGFRADGQLDPDATRIGMTGADGGAVLRDSAPGCRMVASKQGFVPTLAQQLAAPGKPAPGGLRLTKATTPLGAVAFKVSGLRAGSLYIVNLKKGSELAPAALTIWRPDVADGSVLVENVAPAPPGAYVFSIFVPGAVPLQGVVEGEVRPGATLTVAAGLVPETASRSKASFEVPPPATTSNTLGAVLKGRVEDSRGVALAEATVRVSTAGTPGAALCAEAKTGVDGRYETSLSDPVVCSDRPYPLPRDLYFELIGPPGYLSRIEPMPVRAGASSAAVTVDFAPGGRFEGLAQAAVPANPAPAKGAKASVQGKVTDPAGVPLSSMQVELRVKSDPASQLCQAVLTDSDGRYRAFLPDGFYCEGQRWRYPVTFFVWVATGPPVLAERQSVSGVPVVTTVASEKAAAELSWDPRSPQGGVDLRLAHALWPTKSPDTAPADPAAGVPLIQSTPTIVGTVLDDSGHPVMGSWVVARASPDSRSIPCAWGETDVQGRFQLFLPVGVYCGGNALRYPATVHVRLVAPLGLEGDDGSAQVALSGPSQAATLDWGPGLKRAGLKPRPAGGECAGVQPSWRGTTMPMPGAMYLGPGYQPWLGTTLQGVVATGRESVLPGARVGVYGSTDPGAGACTWALTDIAGRYQIWLPERMLCGGEPLRYPATLHLRLEPPIGYEYAGQPAVVSVATAESAVEASWCPGSSLGAPRASKHQGKVCAKVEVSGKPLPGGFVTLSSDDRPWPGTDAFGGRLPHPGPTERSLLRIRDGAFCAKDLAPGNYRVKVSPWNHNAGLRLAYKGLPGSSDDYRLSVDAEGRPLVFDPEGRRVLSVPALPLEYSPALPDADWPQLEIATTWTQRSGSDLDADAVLVAAVTGAWSDDVSDEVRLAWLGGKDGEPSVAMPVPPGRLKALSIWSRRWAVASARPALWDQTADLSVETRRGERLRVELGLAAGVPAAGTVRLPDGTAFRPYQGQRRGEHRDLTVVLRGLRGNIENMVADHEGRYELPALAPGLYVAWFHYKGEAPAWTEGPEFMAWVGAGKPYESEAALVDWSLLRVKDPPRGTKGPAGESGVVVYPTGAIGPKGIMPLDVGLEIGAIPGGDWDVSGLALRPARAVRLKPGKYDVFYVISDVDKPSAFLHVLASAKGVELKLHATTEVELRTEERSGAKGSLAGTVKATRIPAIRELRETKDTQEFYAKLVPQVDLFDGKGHYAASVSLPLSEDGLRRVGGAVAENDPAALEAFVRDRQPGFLIEGLAPGIYRARIAAHGYPTREAEVVIQEGTAAQLDVDFDR